MEYTDLIARRHSVRAYRPDPVEDEKLQAVLDAARLAPTDEKIRNDLGVVYLNQLRVEDARFEFLTALELKQNNTLAGLNLVTLLIYQDDWSRAAELVSRLGLSPAQVTEAQARAERLKAPAKSAPTVAAQVAVATAPALQ